MTLNKQNINPQSGILDIRDRDALERVLVGILLAGPDLFIAATEYPPTQLREAELRLIYNALLASGPPDWRNADAIFIRVCDRLSRFPGALSTAHQLRGIALRISCRSKTIDQIIAALLGHISDDEREGIIAHHRLHFTVNDDEVIEVLRRIQQHSDQARLARTPAA
ncbi:MAG: hypothetical protein K8U57_31405 [Planctomycetes bacterium]|nr:hypothetical protein [Planctomycetota bacterium]